MARSVSEEMTCDLCGTTSRVEPYTIVNSEGARIIDLCAGDAKPLRKLWEAGSAEPRRKVAARGQARTSHAVIPVD